MSEGNQIQDQLEKVSELAGDICKRMGQVLIESGFSVSPLPADGINSARFSGKTDPYSQKQTLEGVWLDSKGQKRGSILFHGDGSFYAEYDVVAPHPKKQAWFVESVTAWGRDKDIKAELKLLPAIS